MVHNKIILTKVFTELKFSATLLYSDLRLLNNFVNFLKGIYDNVTYDSNSTQITCLSAEKKTQAFFWNNRVVIDMDEPNYELFKSITNEVLFKYCKIFESEQFNRVGIRFQWIAPYTDIKEAREVFFDKFFTFIKEIKAPLNIGSINSGKIELHLNSTNNRRLNIAIHPSQVHTLDVKLDPSGAQQKVEKIEGLMLDSDLFEEGKISKDDFLSLLEDADKETRAKVLTLLSTMGVQK